MKNSPQDQISIQELQAKANSLLEKGKEKLDFSELHSQAFNGRIDQVALIVASPAFQGKLQRRVNEIINEVRNLARDKEQKDIGIEEGQELLKERLGLENIDENLARDIQSMLDTKRKSYYLQTNQTIQVEETLRKSIYKAVVDQHLKVYLKRARAIENSKKESVEVIKELNNLLKSKAYISSEMKIKGAPIKDMVEKHLDRGNESHQVLVQGLMRQGLIVDISSKFPQIQSAYDVIKDRFIKERNFKNMPKAELKNSPQEVLNKRYVTVKKTIEEMLEKYASTFRFGTTTTKASEVVSLFNPEVTMDEGKSQGEPHTAISKYLNKKSFALYRDEAVKAIMESLVDRLPEVVLKLRIEEIKQREEEQGLSDDKNLTISIDGEEKSLLEVATKLNDIDSMKYLVQEGIGINRSRLHENFNEALTPVLNSCINKELTAFINNPNDLSKSENMPYFATHFSNHTARNAYQLYKEYASNPAQLGGLVFNLSDAKVFGVEYVEGLQAAHNFIANKRLTGPEGPNNDIKALQFFMEQGDKETVRELVEAGADLRAVLQPVQEGLYEFEGLVYTSAKLNQYALENLRFDVLSQYHETQGAEIKDFPRKALQKLVDAAKKRSASNNLGHTQNKEAAEFFIEMLEERGINNLYPQQKDAIISLFEQKGEVKLLNGLVEIFAEWIKENDFLRNILTKITSSSFVNSLLAREEIGKLIKFQILPEDQKVSTKTYEDYLKVMKEESRKEKDQLFEQALQSENKKLINDILNKDTNANKFMIWDKKFNDNPVIGEYRDKYPIQSIVNQFVINALAVNTTDVLVDTPAIDLFFTPAFIANKKIMDQLKNSLKRQIGMEVEANIQKGVIVQKFMERINDAEGYQESTHQDIYNNFKQEIEDYRKAFIELNTYNKKKEKEPSLDSAGLLEWTTYLSKAIKADLPPDFIKRTQENMMKCALATGRLEECLKSWDAKAVSYNIRDYTNLIQDRVKKALAKERVESATVLIDKLGITMDNGEESYNNIKGLIQNYIQPGRIFDSQSREQSINGILAVILNHLDPKTTLTPNLNLAQEQQAIKDAIDKKNIPLLEEMYKAGYNLEPFVNRMAKDLNFKEFVPDLRSEAVNKAIKAARIDTVIAWTAQTKNKAPSRSERSRLEKSIETKINQAIENNDIPEEVSSRKEWLKSTLGIRKESKALTDLVEHVGEIQRRAAASPATMPLIKAVINQELSKNPKAEVATTLPGKPSGGINNLDNLDENRGIT